VSSARRLAALRNLAERPGTEAEGRVAREMLARIEAKAEPAEQVYAQFEEFLRTGSLDDLGRAIGLKTCDCGNRHPAFTHCPMMEAHQRIAVEIRQRFPRGQRVHYNRWAYPKNCPGRVTGYSGWHWVRVKFDHLKNSRAVPVYSGGLWHLSIAPLDDATLRASELRGGMGKIDDLVNRCAEVYAND